VVLDKLESGYLLFETERGLVRTELSFRQRFYFLWMFRHFRQLSMPVLSARQRAEINALYHRNSGIAHDVDEDSPVIGMIENFVPPATAEVTAKTAVASDAVVATRDVEEAVTPSEEIVPQALPVSAPSRFRGFAWSKMATAGAAVALCIMLAVAWRRMEDVPSSDADNQPAPVSAASAPVLSEPSKPAVAAETAAPTTPLAETSPTPDAVGNAVEPASYLTVIDVTAPPKANVRTPNSGKSVSTPASTEDAPAAPTADLTPSTQDSTIQASRAPLHIVYPANPSVRGISVVALTARVDADGAVSSVKVISGKRALAAAAVRAVRQWRYRPYLKDGLPVETETNIVISFHADDAVSMNFPSTIPAAR
jgi:protein TonB